MPGPLPKKDGGRQRPHRGEARPVVVPINARPQDVPAAPSGLLVASVVAWERLWASPLASTFTETDAEALARLFELRDERGRMWRAARKARLVEGSQGQPRINPLFTTIAAMDAEIRQLEDRFGLSPRARLALGIQLGEARRSLADLNAAFLDEVRRDE
jgi:P27 family predicted phage terminase small subunit